MEKNDPKRQRRQRSDAGQKKGKKGKGQDPTLEPVVQEGTDNLKCILSDAETLEYGKRQARLLDDLKALDNEESAFKADIKSRKAKVDSELSTLSGRIRNGYEHRFVDIHIIKDWAELLVRWVRLDTDEIYNSRPMNAEERQIKMDLETDIQKAQDIQTAEETLARVTELEAKAQDQEGKDAVTAAESLLEPGSQGQGPDQDKGPDDDKGKDEEDETKE